MILEYRSTRKGSKSLASAFVLAGREVEARAAAAEALEISPMFSLEQYAGMIRIRDKSFIDRTIDALRKAGLK